MSLDSSPPTRGCLLTSPESRLCLLQGVSYKTYCVQYFIHGPCRDHYRIDHITDQTIYPMSSVTGPTGYCSLRSTDGWFLPRLFGGVVNLWLHFLGNIPIERGSEIRHLRDKVNFHKKIFGPKLRESTKQTKGRRAQKCKITDTFGGSLPSKLKCKNSLNVQNDDRIRIHSLELALENSRWKWKEDTRGASLISLPAGNAWKLGRNGFLPFGRAIVEFHHPQSRRCLQWANKT